MHCVSSHLVGWSSLSLQILVAQGTEAQSQLANWQSSCHRVGQRVRYLLFIELAGTWVTGGPQVARWS